MMIMITRDTTPFYNVAVLPQAWRWVNSCVWHYV